jgi:hypothetical protein
LLFPSCGNLLENLKLLTIDVAVELAIAFLDGLGSGLLSLFWSNREL